MIIKSIINILIFVVWLLLSSDNFLVICFYADMLPDETSIIVIFSW